MIRCIVRSNGTADANSIAYYCRARIDLFEDNTANVVFNQCVDTFCTIVKNTANGSSEYIGGWAFPFSVHYGNTSGTEDDVTFVGYAIGDYRLAANSRYGLNVYTKAALPTGYNNFVTDASSTDLLGQPRIVAGAVDLGAYETPFISSSPTSR